MKTVSAAPARPMTTIAARQPQAATSKPPRAGLTIATKPRPVSARAITIAPSRGSYRSRTIARAQTTAADIAAPCTARQATTAIT